MSREIETGVTWHNKFEAWFAGTLDGTHNVLRGEGDSEEEAIEDLLAKQEDECSQ
jgi:hypothetical protein